LSTPKKHATNIEKCLAKYSALAEYVTTAKHTPIGLKQYILAFETDYKKRRFLELFFINTYGNV